MVIVGVLTIAGIAGYRYAVDKNAVDAAVDVVNKFLVLCHAHKQNNAAEDCSAVLNELALDADRYNYYDNVDREEFGIIIADVPQKVCTQLIGIDWGDVVVQKVIGEAMLTPFPNAAACDEPTAMAFSDTTIIEPCDSGNKCGATCCAHASSTCSGETCLLPNGCPESAPLKHADSGLCYSCDTPVMVLTRPGAASCTSVCPARSWKSDVCVLCPEGMTLVQHYCTKTCAAGETFVCNNAGKQLCRCCLSDKPKLVNDECVAATTACNSVGGCPAGQFCNYDGAYTPNVCMPINPQTAEVGGVTYYFNTLNDLTSWCRGADNGINCLWGYLARNGASSWCAGIGKRLLTSAELVAATDGLKNILPRGGYGPHLYWTSNGAVNLDTKAIDSARPDGYAWKGGVVCR
ncbi:MAG: hypothetical protein PHX68_00805 [Alphaproteobacteria bacterium]|nr:hypothetical protein [Alphaproteobacteria bacterium]